MLGGSKPSNLSFMSNDTWVLVFEKNGKKKFFFSKKIFFWFCWPFLKGFQGRFWNLIWNFFTKVVRYVLDYIPTPSEGSIVGGSGAQFFQIRPLFGPKKIFFHFWRGYWIDIFFLIPLFRDKSSQSPHITINTPYSGSSDDCPVCRSLFRPF